MLFNDLAREVHAENSRWWHDLITGERLNRDKGELFMLMVSELSEAMEGERKDMMDTHLQHRKMAEVECADFMIRLLDYVGSRGFDLDAGVIGIPLPAMPENKPAALLQIVREIASIRDYDVPGQGRVYAGEHWEVWRLSRAVLMTLRYCDVHGYDLSAAVAEKRAYNATRKDHQREARLAVGGKKF